MSRRSDNASARRRARRGRRGSVLALVLALIVLLSFITVLFIEDATDKLLYDALFQAPEDLRAEAYSALDISLAVLNVFQELDGDLWGPDQGWRDPLSFVDFEPLANTQVQVEFRDESGRFSLAKADFDLLRLVFDELGFDRAVAEELADSLVDWMDEDDLSRLNGFDGEDYEKLDPPYLPTNGPLRSWDELALIPAFQENFWDEDGVPVPELATFEDAFSLYQDGPVNINAAPPFVIQVLDEMGLVDPQNLASYRAGADGELGTADDRLARKMDVGGIFPAGEASDLVSTTSSLLEVSVEVKRGESAFLLRALVSWRGAKTNANVGEPAVEETTEAARTDDEADPDRQARGSAQTAVGDAAALGYPFEILWLAENRKI